MYPFLCPLHFNKAVTKWTFKCDTYLGKAEDQLGEEHMFMVLVIVLHKWVRGPTWRRKWNFELLSWTPALSSWHWWLQPCYLWSWPQCHFSWPHLHHFRTHSSTVLVSGPVPQAPRLTEGARRAWLDFVSYRSSDHSSVLYISLICVVSESPFKVLTFCYCQKCT
jgi:hypothetical protein